MTLLLLIRHALTDSTGKRLTGTTPGIHLSERGRVQAESLGERLAGVKLAAVYASPLERCMETAEAVAGQHGLTPRPLAEVQEVGYGRWTDRPLAQLARTRLWKQVQHNPSSVRFPGGEAMSEAQLRAVAALDGLAARHPRSTIAVVTHADVIRMVVAHYAGVHLDLFQRFLASPASVSVIALGGGSPHIVRLNDTGTLGDLAGGDGHPSSARATSGKLAAAPGGRARKRES